MRRLFLIVAVLFGMMLSWQLPVTARPAIEFGGQVERADSWPADTLRSAGMGWVKIQLFASDMIVGKGVAFVQAAHAQGFNVLASVEGNRDHPMAEADSYIAYLEALAGSGVDALEIWNEPNFTLEWHDTAQHYAELYKHAYNDLKALYPDVMVITAALMPTETNNAVVTSESRWQSELGYLPSDCIGEHFDDWPNISLAQRMAQIRSIYGNRALCFTELGVLSPEGYSTLPASFWWAHNTTAQQQAIALHDMVTQLRSAARMVIVWNVGFMAYNNNDPQAGYSITRPDNSCPFCVLNKE